MTPTEAVGLAAALLVFGAVAHTGYLERRRMFRAFADAVDQTAFRVTNAEYGVEDEDGDRVSVVRGEAAGRHFVFSARDDAESGLRTHVLEIEDYTSVRVGGWSFGGEHFGARGDKETLVRLYGIVASRAINAR